MNHVSLLISTVETIVQKVLFTLFITKKMREMTTFVLQECFGSGNPDLLNKYNTLEQKQLKVKKILDRALLYNT